MGTIGVYQTIKIVLCQNKILAVSEEILLFVQGFKNKNWKFNWFVLKFDFPHLNQFLRSSIDVNKISHNLGVKTLS